MNSSFPNQYVQSPHSHQWLIWVNGIHKIRRAWRNGSAFDSRSKGWVFDSPCPHIFLLFFLLPFTSTVQKKGTTNEEHSTIHSWFHSIQPHFSHLFLFWAMHFKSNAPTQREKQLLRERHSPIDRQDSSNVIPTIARFPISTLSRHYFFLMEGVVLPLRAGGVV